jgi:hypothetical protein
MTADIVVATPLAAINNPPNPIKVGVTLTGLPRSNVTVALTSGDPIGPITLGMIQEYVHARYVDGTIPATKTITGATLGFYTADVFVEIFDDASDASRQILVTQPVANQVKISIPVHLRLSNMSVPGPNQPLSPMGVVARIAIVANLVTAPGSIEAQVATATVTVENLAAAPSPPYPALEGTNYRIDKLGATMSGLDLDALLTTKIIEQGQAIVTAVGDITVTVPTQAQIESFIGEQVCTALRSRGDIMLWTPEPPAGGGVTVVGVVPKALNDALAIGLNPGGAANANAIIDFIPAGRSCAIAVDGAKVTQIIWDVIHRPEADGGFGPDFPNTPKTFNNINGHDARLTSLDISLRDGSIHMEGDVTVVNAIAGSIDVDASFEAEAGLQWIDNPDGSGTQQIEPFTISQDVDLSLLGWILSFLFGFITFGLVGGIIGLVVMAVVEGIAERIGGAVIRDEVTGQIKGIGAWPQAVEGIGTVTARFENPVIIESNGIVFPDAYHVKAIYALTVDALARSNGPYAAPGGTPVTLAGGPSKPDTAYAWTFGDGAGAAVATASHTYADHGVYVAKFTTTVSQPGGVKTRHFARVKVVNVPPHVEAGPPLVIDEGQEVEYVAAFTDPQYPDTHQAVFDFGDDTLPVAGTITETNEPPQAQGNATAKHAYCREGEYTVTIRVRDDDGGVGTDTQRVTVRNVPPTVDAGEDMFAYPCTPITLTACFTDPGWCDTHTGTWDFGDCAPPMPATVREKHNPPAGTGIVAASHLYKCCGTYLAQCTVVDDGGGVGKDAIAVRVVDVLNRDFESGFRQRLVGEVANDWDPYPADIPSALGVESSAKAMGGTTNELFASEEFIVHGGQRSQRIGGTGKFQAGIYQSVGANKKWDYQISVWYHLDERGTGTCRLGVDPLGGTDPGATSVRWSEGSDRKKWSQLMQRVTARTRAITIFLEVVSNDRAAVGYFDDVALIAYPCPLDERVCQPPATALQVCVDWKEEKEQRDLGEKYEKKGFNFSALEKQSIRLVTWGTPAGEGKLVIPRRGLAVKLPFIAERVVARVVANAQDLIVMEAFDQSGRKVGEVAATAERRVVQTIEVSSGGIVAVLLAGGSGEGQLIELCAYEKKDVAEEKPKSFRNVTRALSETTLAKGVDRYQ